MRQVYVLLLIVFLPSVHVFSASGTAKSKQIVILGLNITKMSDLDFGTAPQGDSAKTIPSGTSDTPENASFKVTGSPGHYFQVILPPNNTIKMSLTPPPLILAPAPIGEIPVNNFTANTQSGQLGSFGEYNLLIGATRDPIATGQPIGNYEGEFTITVIY